MEGVYKEREADPSVKCFIERLLYEDHITGFETMEDVDDFNLSSFNKLLG